jgi:tRNA(fMet)-specific endonuclease VapC
VAGKYLIDTNIAILFLNNKEFVVDKIMGSDQIFICSIVVGELLYGARKSTLAKKNLYKYENFINSLSFLPVDIITAKHYSLIKNHLSFKGTPIPENDIWIAAVALQHELMLATDDSHFNLVEGLHIKNWINRS